MIKSKDIKTFSTSGVITLVAAIVFFIGFIIWDKYFAPSWGEDIIKEALPITFKGEVDSVYRDKWNHNVKNAVLSDGYVYGIYAQWESIIDLGDSLSKSKGQLKVEVFKRDGRKVILDYKQLVDSLPK